uniref:SRPBCC family protein n=1 Tax=Rhodosorus marinus TaxID=101924 RepID=A0A7S3E803_9RHOD|mmetsp:Transcript_15385/g.62746  ORF Transcript_15385/g.62746 Transcript_15385/m.62746 type:complete len:165 (+) Transcript_15385:1684-2178(+)|eukprot:CAMPEP_0113956744 /NCGR_PEP_ID=MMETSP0011_2-20120614/2257_1 /TAXON_ID=101924 /ORGANISM="Rhodosorus marinus" /LENGTH=164 /DNA_ID=CAMNT_0000966975 /DNA_START=1585 /DNA_END=2079 /DNA_ORIENTATION=- /assembly_acc=CAM_ASM_000156
MHVKVIQELGIPAAEAWKLMADFNNIQHVHPMVVSVDQLGSKERGVGAIRKCNFYDGGSIQERVTLWDDQNMKYQIQFMNGTLPLNSNTTSMIVEEVDSANCRMICDVEYDPKYGLIGKIMAILFLNRKFGSILGDMLAGVQYYAENHEDVPEGWKAPTRATVV